MSDTLHRDSSAAFFYDDEYTLPGASRRVTSSDGIAESPSFHLSTNDCPVEQHPDYLRPSDTMTDAEAFRMLKYKSDYDDEDDEDDDESDFEGETKRDDERLSPTVAIDAPMPQAEVPPHPASFQDLLEHALKALEEYARWRSNAWPLQAGEPGSSQSMAFWEDEPDVTSLRPVRDSSSPGTIARGQAHEEDEDRTWKEWASNDIECSSSDEVDRLLGDWSGL